MTPGARRPAKPAMPHMPGSVQVARLFDHINRLALRFIKCPRDHFRQQPQQETEDSSHEGKNGDHGQGSPGKKVAVVEIEINGKDPGQDREGEADHAAQSEKIHRLERVFVQKLYRNQIEDHLEDPLQTILRMPGRPRKMIDRLLADFRTVPLRINGQEPVHLSVEAHPFDHFGPVSFERTPEVVQLHAGNGRDKAVGQNAGQVALQRIVFAVLAPAGTNIVALFNPGQQLRQIRRIVLQIAIHRNNDIARSKIETGHHGGGLSEIAPEMHDLDMIVLRRDLVEQSRAAVLAAIIDQNQFPRAAKSRADRGNFFDQRADGLLFVVDGNRDRNHPATKNRNGRRQKLIIGVG